MDDSNMLIQNCERLLETIIADSTEIKGEVKVIPKKGLFQKESTEIYFPKHTEYLLALESINTFKKSVFKSNNHELSFMTLWEYCEFIRWTEKMFLYENNPSMMIYSDSPIDSIDTRTLIINKKGFTIIVNLKISQKADFDNKLEKLVFHQIKEIHVKRNYGKELMNKFRIIDDSVKFNDNSDKILLDLINEIIYETLSNHYSNIITTIDNGNFIGNMLFNNRFVTP